MRPAPQERCPKCGNWEPLSGDRYCSLCGHELFETVNLYVDREKRTSVTESFQVRDRSPGAFSVLRFQHEQWVRISGQDRSVGQHETRVEITVDPGQAGVFPRSCFVSVYDDLGVLNEAEIWLFPAPRSITVKDVSVYLGSAEAMLSFTSDCALEADLELEVDQPNLLSIKVPRQPVKLAQGTAQVPVQVDPRQRGEAKVSFTLTRGSGTGSLILTGTFKAIVKRPPEIVFPDGQLQYFDTHPEDRGTTKVKLQNVGDDPLRIEQVVLECDNPEASWSYELGASEVPAGGSAEVKLEARTTAKARGSIPVTIEFKSNAPRISTCRVNARIVDDVYKDDLAVDYGTSASAVARWDGQKPVNLVLEDSETVIISDVYFRDYKQDRTPPYVFDIGREAARLGRLRRESYVRAVKPRVGTGAVEKLVLQGEEREIPAEDVAQYAVMELLRLTRRQLKARPTRLVFTVPTRFTLHQREVLRDVFVKAAQAKGLEVADPEVVDESLAAGIYYLYSGARRDESIKSRSEYTLLVMDFGGGTTDVTLFRVTQSNRGESTSRCPETVEVIGAWGDQNLGGTVLTLEVGRYIAKQGDVPPDLEPVAPELVKLAVSEVVKPGAGEQSTTDYPLVPRDDRLLEECLGSLHAIPENERYRTWIKEIRKLGAIPVNIARGKQMKLDASIDDILGIARKYLRDFEREMDLFMGRCNLKKADRLLLCGKASLLPTVPQVFSRFAEGTDYVRDSAGRPILKECVSLGAIIYTRVSDEFKLQGERRWWRQVGRLGAATGDASGALAFRALVPWGAEYGKEFRSDKPGLKLVKAASRSGLELRLEENLSLGQEPQTVPYRTYQLEQNVQSTNVRDIPVILKITDKGELEAYCEIGGKREKMEVKSR